MTFVFETNSLFDYSICYKVIRSIRLDHTAFCFLIASVNSSLVTHSRLIDAYSDALICMCNCSWIVIERHGSTLVVYSALGDLADSRIKCKQQGGLTGQSFAVITQVKSHRENKGFLVTIFLHESFIY